MLLSNFFNQLAIITKVNIIFFVSILTISGYTALEFDHNYQIYKNAEIVEEKSADSLAVVSLIHELQKERGLSTGYVGNGDSKFFKELEIQTQKTDEKMVKLDEHTMSLLNVNMIKNMRDSIKKRTVKNDDILKFYSDLNENILQYVSATFHYSSKEKDIFEDSFGYSNFLYAKENLGILRAAVVDILAKKYMGYEEKKTLIGLIEKQQFYIKNFLSYVDDKAKKKYEEITKSEAFNTSELITTKLLQTDTTNTFGIDALYAFDTFTERIDLYQEVEYFLADKLINSAKELKIDAEYAFLFYSFLSVLLLIFLLVLKHFTGLNIYRTVEALHRSLKSFDKHVIASNTNQHGVITYASEAFCKITGYTEDELMGQPHSIIRHDDMPKKLFFEIWNTITAGHEYKGEIKNRKKSGEMYWLNVIISPQYDKKNNLTGFSAVGQDITDKKALEALKNTLELQVENRTIALEKERHFIDTVLNTQEQMIITTNAKTIISANKAFMNFYNIKNLKEFTDMHSCICDTFCADSPKGYLQTWIKGKHWTEYILDNPTVQHKAMIIKDGIKHIFSVTLSLVSVEDELLEVAVFSDITQIENSKEEIKRKVQEGLVEIENLNEEIVETQREIVFTMGTICETKSEETGNHVKRVAAYTELLALKYGMAPEEAKLLKEASPMHDVGKIGIDDDILKKPGALTDKEFEIMKTHTLIGYDMLKSSKKAILKTAAIVAKEHHEKYDGTGYPERLKGNEIHIYGRITALADVFDALGNDRCYKKAWSDEKIFQLFRKERGKHFDPDLVDIFFDNVDQFLAIRDRHKDTPEECNKFCVIN